MICGSICRLFGEFRIDGFDVRLGFVDTLFATIVGVSQLLNHGVEGVSQTALNALVNFPAAHKLLHNALAFSLQRLAFCVLLGIPLPNFLKPAFDPIAVAVLGALGQVNRQTVGLQLLAAVPCGMQGTVSQANIKFHFAQSVALTRRH